MNEKAFLLERTGNLHAALPYFEDLYKEHAEEHRVVCGLMASLLRADRWREVIELGEKHGAGLQDSARFHALWGEALYRGGRYHEAEAHSQRGEALDPGQFEVRIGAARTLLARGEAKKAFRILSAARKQDHMRPEPLLLEGSGAVPLRMYTKAKEAYFEMMRMAPRGYPFELIQESLAAYLSLVSYFLTHPTEILHPAGGAVIPMDLDGPLATVEGKVHGQGPYTFLVDTGGSYYVTLDKSFEKTFGFRHLGAFPARGIGGKVKESIPFSLLEEVTFGDLVLKQSPVLLYDLSAISAKVGRQVHGILPPGNFFEKALTFDMAAGNLVIGDPPAPLGTEYRECVKWEEDGRARLQIPFLTIGDGKIFVEAEIGGEKNWVIFDSGASAELLAQDLFARAVPDETRKEMVQAVTGLGDEYTSEVSLWVAPSLDWSLGETKYTMEPVVGYPKFDEEMGKYLGFRPAGIIGMGFLRANRSVTVDFVHRVMTIKV